MSDESFDAPIESAAPAPAAASADGLWRVLPLFATWWLLLQSFAVLAFGRFRLSDPDHAFTWTSQIIDQLPLRWQGFVDLHSRFDSGFYTWIAGQGYTADNAAYLPLYPLLIRLTVEGCALFSSCNFPTAAFIVSNLSALGAALALYLLARVDADRAAAERGVFYFLIFPTAFFLSAIYTESLFVLFAALSLHSARRERWPLAAILGMFATLTRASGLALFAALVVEAWTQRRLRDALWLALIPLAFVSFVLVLSAQGLSFFETEHRLFGRTLFSFGAWRTQLDWDHMLSQPAAQVNFGLEIGLALFVLGGALLAAWRWRPSYGVYAALVVLLPALTVQSISLNRYALVAFTVPLLLARYGHHAWLDRAYTLAATLLLALYTILFVQGYWAG